MTYVNPNNGVRARQKELQQWGFGKCTCERCVKEAKDIKIEEVDESSGPFEMNDLEKELKAGFGLM